MWDKIFTSSIDINIYDNLRNIDSDESQARFGKVAGIILVMAVMAIPFQFVFLLWIYESIYADD